MTATSKESASDREILLVGPYGVLGTGVIDAVAANPAWRVTTAARRPAPRYRTQIPPRHISVDLMDREGTIKAFSNLDTVTDLVFAAYVEKPTMAETVEPNARMLTNTLEALAARDVPLRRIVLSGGAKSYGFSLGAFPSHRADPLSPTGGHCGRLVEQEWSELDGFASASRDGDKLEFANESCDEPRYIRRDEPRTRAAVAVSRPPRRVEHTSGDH